MRKSGMNWEDVTVDDISVEDLDEESFRIFRREALRSKRMTAAELNVPNEELLSKLHLMRDGKLKRSAVLLFYRDPSALQNGSYVKVGRFSEQGELLYQDLLEGSLFTTADKIMDLIFLKYLKAKVTYEHDRVWKCIHLPERESGKQFTTVSLIIAICSGHQSRSELKTRK